MRKSPCPRPLVYSQRVAPASVRRHFLTRALPAQALKLLVRVGHFLLSPPGLSPPRLWLTCCHDPRSCYGRLNWRDYRYQFVCRLRPLPFTRRTPQQYPMQRPSQRIVVAHKRLVLSRPPRKGHSLVGPMPDFDQRSVARGAGDVAETLSVECQPMARNHGQ